MIFKKRFKITLKMTVWNAYGKIEANCYFGYVEIGIKMFVVVKMKCNMSLFFFMFAP